MNSAGILRLVLLACPSQLPALPAMIPRRSRRSGIGRHGRRQGACCHWSCGRLRRNRRGYLRSGGIDVCARCICARCVCTGCALCVQPGHRTPEEKQHSTAQNHRMKTETGGDSDHGVCHRVQESASGAALQCASMSVRFFEPRRRQPEAILLLAPVHTEGGDSTEARIEARTTLMRAAPRFEAGNKRPAAGV